jgi:hypothetical protein
MSRLDKTKSEIDLLEPISPEVANRILANTSLREDFSKRGVDLGMIVSNLKLTLEQRVEKLQGLLKIQSTLRKAPWILDSKK